MLLQCVKVWLPAQAKLAFGLPQRNCSAQVSINTECSFVRDVLRGSDVSELRLKLLSLNKEDYPFKDDD